MLSHDLHIRTNRHGVLDRRSFIRNIALGAAGASSLGWMDAVRLEASEIRKQGKACILLFMRGGPSQFETFDPKPGVETGGPTLAIDTPIPGIQIAENWPETAKIMNDVALIRSMTNREGNHQRAAYQLHTGYVPSGSVKYPGLGSIVASELGSPDFDLPHFVSIGGRFAYSSGYLGMSYAPFVVPNANRLPLNVTLPRNVDDSRLNRRLGLMNRLEEDFAASGAESKVLDHRALYDSASKLALSPNLVAFDLDKESDQTRDQYGRNNFGQGCLLARRLVETGVTFIEVTSNGWDTHNDNFDRTKNLAGVVDPAFSALVSDLKQRGMLDKTLVIWMGEFGRTPRINPRTGRDHYPRAFNVALAGGGIKGGQVIGRTSADGTAVEETPVSVADLFCSFCHSLKINPRKEYMSGVGRPIKIVDGGSAVKELFV